MPLFRKPSSVIVILIARDIPQRSVNGQDLSLDKAQLVRTEALPNVSRSKRSPVVTKYQAKDWPFRDYLASPHSNTGCGYCSVFSLKI